MSNPMLKATTKAQVRVNGWMNTTVDAMKRRADKGQGAVEYMGIIVVVVAIILVLTQTNFGNAIRDKITAAINKITP
ncbi:hypothetical protein ACFYMW_29365 [Streptomyces sp. NPDC006692]|uniref:hypothetical protein n=1 Tax=unclassified Streptomyces TaxID=2593676 RepID=UPI0036B13300